MHTAHVAHGLVFDKAVQLQQLVHLGINPGLVPIMQLLLFLLALRDGKAALQWCSGMPVLPKGCTCVRAHLSSSTEVNEP